MQKKKNTSSLNIIFKYFLTYCYKGIANTLNQYSYRIVSERFKLRALLLGNIIMLLYCLHNLCLRLFINIRMVINRPGYCTDTTPHILAISFIVVSIVILPLHLIHVVQQAYILSNLLALYCIISINVFKMQRTR